MDLETIWASFINTLSAHEKIEHVSYKKAAGIPFLYIRHTEHASMEEILSFIKKAAAKSMRGRKLHSETVFVRKEKELLVFRHRFYVPQRKMFCCGNLCPDCIRFENEKY